MADERQPDHTEDPRGQDVGQGYPESQAGTGDDAIEKGAYPDDSEHGGTTVDGPSQSDEEDSGPSKATGNPHAAGGDD
jgi:hypothetical protein